MWCRTCRLLLITGPAMALCPECDLDEEGARRLMQARLSKIAVVSEQRTQSSYVRTLPTLLLNAQYLKLARALLCLFSYQFCRLALPETSQIGGLLAELEGAAKLAPPDSLINQWVRLFNENASRLERGGAIMLLQLAQEAGAPADIAAEARAWLDSGAAPGPWLRRLDQSPATPSWHVQTFEGPGAAFKVTVDTTGTRAVSTSPRALAVWSLRDRMQYQIIPLCLESDAAIVPELALFPDGARAVSWAAVRNGADRSTQLAIWELTTGDCLASWSDNVRLLELLVHPDGERIVCAYTDAIKVFAVDDRSRRPLQVLLPSLLGNASAMRISADGRRLIVIFRTGLAPPNKGNTLRVWDLADGRCLTEVGGLSNSWTFDVFPDGRRVLLIGDEIGILDLQTGEVSSPIPNVRVGKAALHPDGQHVLATFRPIRQAGQQPPLGGGLMVADLSTRETFTTEEVATNRCNSLAWIPGSFLALSTHDDGAVRVWNCESRVDVPQPQSHKGPISALVSHPDRALVVSAGRDHTLRTWDTTGTPRICLGPYTADVMELALDRKRDEACVFFENGPLLIYNMQSGEEVDGLDLELCGDIRAATVREGEQLAITGVANRQGQDPVEGLILQMDLESLDELAVWRAHQERIWALAAHPNGRWLLSASEDGSAKAWDLETLSCRQSVEINEPITAMAVHQDGQFVLLAGMSIWLWHLGSGHCVRSAVRHQEQVRSIALHPAGKIGASVGLDRTLLLWELDPLRCVGRWDADTQLVACVFSLDGVLVTGGASGELAFFRLVGFPGGPQ